MSTIAENLARIQSAKTDIKAAIEAKGVTVPSSATIDTYDDYVAQITGGGGIPMPSKLSSASLNDYGVITSAEIKSGVTSIGDMAFQYCNSLTSITIPDTVTIIGSGAFQNCWNLSSVAIPDSVTSISENAFYNCGSLSSVAIPDSVTSIGDGAFNYCGSLSSVAIPDSVTTIGDNAFQNCFNLSSVTIPDSVTSIGDGAFSNCFNLSSIVCNATTPATLGSGVFDSTNDCPIYVPAASVSAYQSAWSDYSSRIVAIPSPTFQGKWLATYTGGTTSSAECDASSAITDGEITLTDLVSVETGPCVTSIGNSAFFNCGSLTSCTLDNSVTSIEQNAFYGCRSLTSIDIPSGVTSINAAVFYGCYALTSIVIPSGVTSIGEGAFYNCTGMTEMTVEATTPPTLGVDVFNRVPLAHIYVPSGCVSAYQSASGWSDFSSIITAIQN